MHREKMNSSGPKRMSPMRMSLLLATSVACVAVVVSIATFGHASRSCMLYCGLAALWTATAAITPIWLESLIFNGGTFQLAVVAFRLITMLGAFVVAGTFAIEERKYFLTTLMACYFVALPLESWLLARRASQ